MGYEFNFRPYAYPAKWLKGYCTDGLCFAGSIVIRNEKVNRNTWDFWESPEISDYWD